MTVVNDIKVHTRQIKESDSILVKQIIGIEKLSFGEGGLHNEWLLIPFIRYGRVYVMENSTKVIAAAQFLQNWGSTDEAYFYGISVLPEFRGKGFGTAFIDNILKDLQKSGIKRVILSVSPDNRTALRLYENRFGFNKKAYYENEYGLGEHRYVMERFL